MSKPKPQTVQTPYASTNTYSWQQMPDTADVQALRDTSVVPEGLAPALKAQLERNQEQTRNRLESSYNQNIPQNVRENTALQANRELASDYGNALLQSDYAAKEAEYNKKMAIASLTRPQLVQSGSSGYNTQAFQNQGSGFWGQLAGGVATGAIMA